MDYPLSTDLRQALHSFHGQYVLAKALLLNRIIFWQPLNQAELKVFVRFGGRCYDGRGLDGNEKLVLEQADATWTQIVLQYPEVQMEIDLPRNSFSARIEIPKTEHNAFTQLWLDEVS